MKIAAKILNPAFDGAVCAEVPEADDIMFPATNQHFTLARAICARCPIATRTACLEVAMTAEAGQGRTNRFGMFGGLSPAERHALNEKRGDS